MRKKTLNRNLCHGATNKIESRWCQDWVLCFLRLPEIQRVGFFLKIFSSQRFFLVLLELCIQFEQIISSQYFRISFVLGLLLRFKFDLRLNFLFSCQLDSQLHWGKHWRWRLHRNDFNFPARQIHLVLALVWSPN